MSGVHGLNPLDRLLNKADHTSHSLVTLLRGHLLLVGVGFCNIRRRQGHDKLFNIHRKILLYWSNELTFDWAQSTTPI